MVRRRFDVRLHRRGDRQCYSTTDDWVRIRRTGHFEILVRDSGVPRAHTPLDHFETKLITQLRVKPWIVVGCKIATSLRGKVTSEPQNAAAKPRTASTTLRVTAGTFIAGPSGTEMRTSR
jgi:hypothetical protein